MRTHSRPTNSLNTNSRIKALKENIICQYQKVIAPKNVGRNSKYSDLIKNSTILNNYIYQTFFSAITVNREMINQSLTQLLDEILYDNVSYHFVEYGFKGFLFPLIFLFKLYLPSNTTWLDYRLTKLTFESISELSAISYADVEACLEMIQILCWEDFVS